MGTIVTDWKQGPPGPIASSVADLASLAALCTTTFVAGTLAFVQAPVSSYYSWSPADTETPNGSTIVAGMNGNWLLCAAQTGAVAMVGSDGVVALPSGVTIAQSQLAHERMVPLLLQPSVAGTGAHCIALDSVQFNSTFDNVMHVGYNPFGAVSSQPRSMFTVEANYESVPGVVTVEMHAQILDPAYPQYGLLRPFSAQYVLGSSSSAQGRLVSGIQYSDGPGGPGTGYSLIAELSTGATQIKWLTGQTQILPANYEIIATNGLTIQSSTNGSAIELLTGDGASQDAIVIDNTNHRSYFLQGSSNVLFINSTNLNSCVPVTLSTPAAAPPAPATGFTLYVDEADGKLKAIAASGTVTVLASP
jgi:hypothetical protein